MSTPGEAVARHGVAFAIAGVLLVACTADPGASGKASSAEQTSGSSVALASPSPSPSPSGRAARSSVEPTPIRTSTPSIQAATSDPPDRDPGPLHADRGLEALFPDDYGQSRLEVVSIEATLLGCRGGDALPLACLAAPDVMARAVGIPMDDLTMAFLSIESDRDMPDVFMIALRAQGISGTDLIAERLALLTPYVQEIDPASDRVTIDGHSVTIALRTDLLSGKGLDQEYLLAHDDVLVILFWAGPTTPFEVPPSVREFIETLPWE